MDRLNEPRNYEMDTARTKTETKIRVNMKHVCNAKLAVNRTTEGHGKQASDSGYKSIVD